VSPQVTGTDINNTTARAVEVVRGLTAPWGAAVLPDGRLLVTQRTLGSFALVNLVTGRIDATVGGVLPVSGTGGQGGMLDVALDPAFLTNGRIYWTFTEGQPDGSVAVAVARARLVGASLQDVTVIYRQNRSYMTWRHHGSRLAFRADGTLFITIGDNGQDNPDAPSDQFAQNTALNIGKVVRITTDGAPAPGNPNFGAGAVPGLWSMGHRNPQGAAVHPGTGELWVSEHGPLGGDEINIARAGGNHGWPFASYGCNYGQAWGESCRLGGGTHTPRFTEPVTTWVPNSIATGGIVFNAIGTRYPGWEGNLFVGAMSGIPNGGQSVWRLTLNGNSVVGREYMLKSLKERMRQVIQTPEGWIYLLTDSGRILRLQQR
jgi:glucose/arabinose dehydrogenase